MAVVLPGKFLYLANYHVASLATARALDEQVEGTYRVGPHHASPDRLVKVRQHPFVSPHAILQPSDVVLGDEIVFATVRNPYDWLVSCWLRNGGSASFLTYVSDLSDTSRGGYIRDGRAFWHRPNHLLRWETLQDDLNSLLKQVGVPPVWLPRINTTSGKKHWRTYYDDPTAKVAEERFGGMAALFGYNPSLRLNL